MKKFKNLVFVLCTLLLCVGLYSYFKNMENKPLDPGYLLGELSKSSELTTAKLTFDGYYEYKDEGKTFLHRGDFLMIYNATAEAGIDLKNVVVKDIDEVNNISYIGIPHASIQKVTLNLDKPIKFFDESFAPFNWDDKSDVAKAENLAEICAEEYIANTGILEFADQSAFELIESLLRKIDSRYTYELVFI